MILIVNRANVLRYSVTMTVQIHNEHLATDQSHNCSSSPCYILHFFEKLLCKMHLFLEVALFVEVILLFTI